MPNPVPRSPDSTETGLAAFMVGASLLGIAFRVPGWPLSAAALIFGLVVLVQQHNRRRFWAAHPNLAPACRAFRRATAYLDSYPQEMYHNPDEQVVFTVRRTLSGVFVHRMETDRPAHPDDDAPAGQREQVFSYSTRRPGFIFGQADLRVSRTTTNTELDEANAARPNVWYRHLAGLGANRPGLLYPDPAELGAVTEQIRGAHRVAPTS